MSLYADIAFPTPVRKLFTYKIERPGEVNPEEIKPGMRVWVPLRGENAIGLVINVHERNPEFPTRPVLRVLDTEPILDEHQLQLADWIHRFYYCSIGEVVQAALPAGLNFIAEKKLRLAENEDALDRLPVELREMAEEILDDELTLESARRRWRENPHSGRLKKLISSGVVEVWEIPKQKVRKKTEKAWVWNDAVDKEDIDRLIEESGNYKWIEALQQIRRIGLPAGHKALLDDPLVTGYTLRRIEDEGIILSQQKPVEIENKPDYRFEPSKINQLTQQQQEVYEEVKASIRSQMYSSFLLHGVTGSGKTEIYIHALKQALSQGQGGIVLVPEIALTPQTVRRFYQIFGDRIAVLHSRLSDRERAGTWEKLKKGKKRVAIGPRSAIFAPVQNLGLIIVDEEHDTSYKQFDPAPRYHARDVAVMRGLIEEATVLMGSATPSLGTLHAAYKGKHRLLKLPGRRNAEMPEVIILDLKQYKSAMYGPLAVELHEAVTRALEQNEQVILLYNRRGYASYLQCEDCGHIPQSPDSSVSLTYHRTRDILLCHYSGYSRKADRICRECGSRAVAAKGSGTQQIEQQLKELYPEARLLRMDRDTTAGKESHREIYEKFLSGSADILIGTQLVSKGLDFPDVTVVGVLGAETEMAFPSFRSGERTFQLLSQVAGRAGRGRKKGTVYIQTWRPDHRAIKMAAGHDYTSFAETELNERRELGYPPYSRMVVFHFRGRSNPMTGRVAEQFTAALRQVVRQLNSKSSAKLHENRSGDSAEDPPVLSVLGPSPSVIEFVNRQYRWETHLKIPSRFNASAIEKLMDVVFTRYESIKPKGGSGIRIGVDVDAVE